MITRNDLFKGTAVIMLSLLLSVTPSIELYGMHHGNRNGAPGNAAADLNVDKAEISKIPVRPDFDWSRVDELFSEWDKPGSPGAVLGVIHNGELIYQKGYGEANLDYNIPITHETVFYIGSVSKQFAAACIAIMADKGLIGLDDDIREYIPEMPDYGEPILIRHLVHHTSGVRDLYSVLNFAELNVANVLSLDEKLEAISSQSDLNFAPGEEYLYSNSGYTLMTVLVERVTGKTLREFSHEHIFEPLGMHNTHFHDNRTQVVKNRALSYQRRGEDFIVSYLMNFEGVGPGGLYTTIGDMLKWDRNFYDNSLHHSPNFNSIMYERGVLNNGDTLDYAFGIRFGDHRGVKTVGHGGSFMGFRADYLRFPEQEFSVVIFSNLGSISPGGISTRIADLYLEDLFSGKLEKYQGTYVNPDHDTMCKVVKDGGDLRMIRPVSPSGRMTHRGEGVFSLGGWVLEFYNNDGGEVEGFMVNTGRARNVRYIRE